MPSLKNCGEFFASILTLHSVAGAAREKRLSKKKKKEAKEDFGTAGGGDMSGGAATGSEPQMSSRKAAEAVQIKYESTETLRPKP